jgi:hypothetical protein
MPDRTDHEQQDAEDPIDEGGTASTDEGGTNSTEGNKSDDDDSASISDQGGTSSDTQSDVSVDGDLGTKYYWHRVPCEMIARKVATIFGTTTK